MEPRKTLYALTTMGAFLVLGACQAQQQDGEAAIETTESSMAEAVEPELPDTTAASVWEYLGAVDYQDAWAVWPGLTEFYGGGEPHGMLLTTYVNVEAHEAVTAGSEHMPPDAVVVKENYMPDSTLAAVTVMYKVPGYNEAHADWFFAKYQPDGAVDAAGRVEGCQGCHAAGPDYIMTSGFGGETSTDEH